MLKIVLYPLTVIYGIVIYIRNRLYDLNIFKSTEFDIPVISVGNITVGGTGKTPHTEYLAALLKEQFNVVTLSRGYMRQTKGFREVEIHSLANETGDEPLQMKNKFPEIGVFVDENRVHGINEILKLKANNQPDVILLDDAFQHRRVTPGINVLLIDYNRPIEEDMLLPVGRLREGKGQARRANIIVFTKCPDEITPITRRITMKNVNLRPFQSLYFTKMKYGELTPVISEMAVSFSSETMKEFAVLMVCGIANPEPFKKHLSMDFGEVHDVIFPDHHHFAPADIEKIETEFDNIQNKNKIIVTTEKDAIRLKDMQNLPDVLKKYLFYIPITIHFLDSEGKSFDQKIVNYVRENKSNRELHKRKNQSAG